METALAKDDADTGLDLVTRPNEYIAESLAGNTRRGYASDFRRFTAWCESCGLESLPAEPATVAAYFSAMADSGRRASTINRARAAIRMAHETAGNHDPTAHKHVKLTLKGIRRTLGTAGSKKSPTLAADIKAMIGTLPDSLLGLRDRALILVGFAGAFRRSELVAIRTEHIEHTAEGIRILLPRSKTDQEGQGRHVGIIRGSHPSTCPVRALDTWIDSANIASGAVFRRVDRHGNVGDGMTAQSVALVVKRAADTAGLDASKYSGHSLRAGFVTEATLKGATETNIMRQTGHRSHATVQGYVRIASVFTNNPSGMLGL